MTSSGATSPPPPRAGEPPHVSVCVCTYKRAQLLRQLLAALAAQDTGGLFTYSIVVVDNDRMESARTPVSESAARTPVAIAYRVEPRRSIALARNAAVDNSSGDLLAFIDDDEEPPRDWLLQLIRTLAGSGADGVLGPVVPRFATPPPEWIRRGRLFDRPSPPTGTWLRWHQTRTGNVLLRRRIFTGQRNRFDAQYERGGEDAEFFRRMIANGLRFVWCAEAAVDEIVPAERCSRKYLLQRALRRGRAPCNQGWPVLVSLVAVPAYAAALPVLLLFGQHVFMRYLIKECDHLGRILAFPAALRLWRRRGERAELLR